MTTPVVIRAPQALQSSSSHRRKKATGAQGSYSYDKPKWLAGTIVKINKGRVEVQWDIDEETVEVSSHYLTPWYSKDHKNIEKSNKQTTRSVMAMLEVGAELKHSNDDLNQPGQRIL